MNQPPVHSFQKGRSFQMTRVIVSLIQKIPIPVCGSWETGLPFQMLLGKHGNKVQASSGLGQMRRYHSKAAGKQVSFFWIFCGWMHLFTVRFFGMSFSGSSGQWVSFSNTNHQFSTFKFESQSSYVTQMISASLLVAFWMFPMVLGTQLQSLFTARFAW